MEKVNYRLALQAAMAEQSELFEERRRIDARLATLKATIEGLSALVQDKPAEPTQISEELLVGSSITGAIRVVLMHSNVPLSPTQIRTELAKNGFDLSEYANEMTVIHNTLKRLEGQGELLTVKDSSDKVIAYTTRFHADGVYASVPMNTPGTEMRSKVKTSKTPAEQIRDLREIQNRNRGK
jgi:hypothetical protein